jgi:hypothetical protein
MDVPHRFFTLSTDLRAGGDVGEPVLGRHWLVISTLALLVVSAAVFLVS